MYDTLNLYKNLSFSSKVKLSLTRLHTDKTRKKDYSRTVCNNLLRKCYLYIERNGSLMITYLGNLYSAQRKGSFWLSSQTK